MHKYLLKLRGFQCIGGGYRPVPMSCRMLGWVTRQKARCLALVEAMVMDALGNAVGGVLMQD